jgi:hypothetical protein
VPEGLDQRSGLPPKDKDIHRVGARFKPS